MKPKPARETQGKACWTATDIAAMLERDHGMDPERVRAMDVQELYDQLVAVTPASKRPNLEHVVVVDGRTVNALIRVRDRIIRELRPEWVDAPHETLFDLPHHTEVESRSAIARKLKRRSGRTLSLDELETAYVVATGENVIVLEDEDHRRYVDELVAALAALPHGRWPGRG